MGTIVDNHTDPIGFKNTSAQDDNHMKDESILSSGNDIVSKTGTSPTPSSPPPLPHVNVNQLPLSILVRNLCLFAIGEIKQFFKLSKPNKRFEFLQMIIYLRNQFLRLYVLIKWCKTIKKNNFHLLIDLLNYLRQQNMNIGHCIWHLKNSVISSTINAKLPNPDLETALEVFNLGRPNLNDEDHIVNNNNNDNDSVIPVDLIKKKLRDLDVLLSIRVAMMDLPYIYKLVQNHYIQDGRLTIRIMNEYELQLSTATPYSPFYFVDFKLLLEDVHDNTSSSTQDRKSFILKKNINDLLQRERDNPKILYVLEEFLAKYILSLKIYLCHRKLNKLAKQKYSNNLIYKYDQKNSLINIRYWVSSRIVAQTDCKLTIGIKKYSLKDEDDHDKEETDLPRMELVLKWGITNLDSLPFKITTTYNTDILNTLFDVIDEIIFNHIQIIKHHLVSIDNGIFTNNTIQKQEQPLPIENDENLETKNNSNGMSITMMDSITGDKNTTATDMTSLTIYLPSTCTTNAPVKLKINPITGLLFFSNPNSQLLLNYMDRLNRNMMTPQDIVHSLYQLKLAKTVHILSNMFSKCGWTVFNNNSMKLPLNVLHPHHQKISLQKANILIEDIFIRLSVWPANWYLVVSVFSSPSSCFVEFKIAKIISKKGKWCLKYISDNLKDKIEKDEHQDTTTSSSNMTKLEHISYQRIDFFSTTILSKIINHIILDSLNELGIEKNIVTESHKSMLPKYVSETFDQDNSSTVIAMDINSLMKTSVSILDSTVFLIINFSQKSEQNKISLYGRFSMLFDTQLLRSSDCAELMIKFIDDKCFVMETSTDERNSRVVDHLNSFGNQLAFFKKKLSHLIVLSDVINRLTQSFNSPDFKVISLKPNEVKFNYLPSVMNSLRDEEKSDCTIRLPVQSLTQKDTRLEFQLDSTNPQAELNPFIQQSNYDHEFLFKYFQFTSNLFVTIENFKKSNNPINSPLFFRIHSMSQYQLSYIYYDESLLQIEEIALLIDIKTKIIKKKQELLFFVRFAQSPSMSTRCGDLMTSVKSQCFEIKKPILNNTEPVKLIKCKTVVKLNNAVCCSDIDMAEVLTEIHKILTA